MSVDLSGFALEDSGVFDLDSIHSVDAGSAVEV